jgi:hypothetical protein
MLGSLVLLLLLLVPSTVRAQEENRAGLVIVHGDGRVVQQCVFFAEESISGYELLQRAGGALSVEAGAMGATVCSIDGEGCSYPAEACFCRCQGSPCVYWSYWRLQAGGGWRYQPLGAGNTRVQDGDVEAWRWAEGTTQKAPEPPPATFDDICAPVVQASASQPTAETVQARSAPAEQTPPAPGAPVETSTAAPTPALATAAGAPAQESQAAGQLGPGVWLLLAGAVALPAAVLLAWALMRRGR